MPQARPAKPIPAAPENQQGRVMRRAVAEPRADRATTDLTLPVAAAVLAGLLVVRLVALSFNATDLFFDEAQYWSWSREPAFGYYSKPPLIAAIIGAATAACGDAPFCVRMPAPLIHTATAVLVLLIARRLYDQRVAAWSAITFATLPGISFSSGIISTDVPLLACWALAMLGVVGLLQEPKGWWPAAALGLGLGLGLNAKYAMAFLPLSLGVYMVAVPAARGLLRDPRLWAGLALGAAMIAPNLAWNAAHKFATFAHTADNAKWGGKLLQPGKGLEFLAGQLAVFGPLMIAGLVLVVRRGWSDGLRESDKLLLSLTLPVLAVITAQAFVSRAHANWAATAYVAASILVPAVLLRLGQLRWLGGSLALHVAVLALLMVATAAAGRFVLPGIGDPFQRTLGWEALGRRTAEVLAEARRAGRPFRTVMADDRSVTATMLYYMRDAGTPIVAWQSGPRPLDHYELTRPFKGADQTPVLLVATRRDHDRITAEFANVRLLSEDAIAAGLGKPRTVSFIALDTPRR
jgi:4-amino-4-deoxy-L-arabinose transferase-like glycosyltransferase